MIQSFIHGMRVRSQLNVHLEFRLFVLFEGNFSFFLLFILTIFMSLLKKAIPIVSRFIKMFND